MALEITWESNGVYRKFFDTVSTADLNRAVQEVHEDPRFDGLTYSINDFLEVTSVDVPKSAVGAAVLKTIGDSGANRKILLAVVTANQEVRALVEFYINPSYLPYPAKICQTVDEARAWISDQSLTA